MSLREVRVKSVRSYELFSARLDPGITLILGRNGTGKTTLLEAIYYLMMGTSFRGRDRDMIAHDSTRADIQLVMHDEAKRRASLQISADDTIKKSFTINGKTSQRLPLRQRLPTVLFEPDDLRLLSSSPERRRGFYDGMLARLYPGYQTILGRYQRTLLQRNELLKRHDMTSEKAWDDQLFIWDIKYAELAEQIVSARREFVVTANQSLSNLYSDIARGQHHVVASYYSPISQDTYQQTLLARLHESRTADANRGYTTVGPHRDDILISLDGHPVSETASRGEMRTVMLAHKLLEVALQHEITTTKPLILLDDVFSELDTTREHALLAHLADHQTIITATDLRSDIKSGLTTITLS